jgi:pimeloyl-ACP methyl ester carboxylesterase
VTAVLVHGVPDTHRLWDRLRAELDRDDVVTPDLPGFGCPVPAGFGATKEEYVDWLIGEVESLGAPVDLVGHDWGSILVQRLACVRPDLVRTWAAGGGPVDPAYEWHQIARVWQTPGAGEELMAGWTPDVLRAAAAGLGIPPDYAEIGPRFLDDTMKDCILRLYRSAVEVSAEWGPDLEQAPARALLVWGGDDAFCAPEIAERSAKRVGGDALVLPGCGHWWPLERPAEVAAALEQLWGSAASSPAS